MGRPMTNEEIEQAINLQKSGKQLAEIGEILGFHPSTVCQRMKHYVGQSALEANRKNRDASLTDLIAKLNEKGKAVFEIANILDLSKKQVIKKAKEANIYLADESIKITPGTKVRFTDYKGKKRVGLIDNLETTCVNSYTIVCGYERFQINKGRVRVVGD